MTVAGPGGIPQVVVHRPSSGTGVVCREDGTEDGVRGRREDKIMMTQGCYLIRLSAKAHLVRCRCGETARGFDSHPEAVNIFSLVLATSPSNYTLLLRTHDTDSVTPHKIPSISLNENQTWRQKRRKKKRFSANAFWKPPKTDGNASFLTSKPNQVRLAVVMFTLAHLAGQMHGRHENWSCTNPS